MKNRKIRKHSGAGIDRRRFLRFTSVGGLAAAGALPLESEPARAGMGLCTHSSHGPNNQCPAFVGDQVYCQRPNCYHDYALHI